MFYLMIVLSRLYFSQFLLENSVILSLVINKFENTSFLSSSRFIHLLQLFR